jgi:hypothetical protein
MFYGGWLRRAEGRLWLGLRACLWLGFVVAVLHAALAMQLPLPERRTSPHADLMVYATTFYFGCFVLFGSTFGVHAIAIYRLFWEFFHRSSRPGGTQTFDGGPP